MARFKSVERPKETICNLIQKSMQKIKNKKGRFQGRRSKGVQKGLLREVLVKGVVTNLVKVANKELRFPREITRDYRSNQTGSQSPSPRLTSPTKSPQPKRWQSPPANTKRNLLKIELQNNREKNNFQPPQDSSESPLSKTMFSASPKQSPAKQSTKTRTPSPKASSPIRSSKTIKSVDSIPSASFDSDVTSDPKSPTARNISPKKRTSSPSVSTFGKSPKSASSGSPRKGKTPVKNSSSTTAQTSSKKTAAVRHAAPRRPSKIEAYRSKLAEQRRAKLLGLASVVGSQKSCTRTRVVATVKRLRRK